jgi:anti-sigma factor RsiW
VANKVRTNPKKDGPNYSCRAAICLIGEYLSGSLDSRLRASLDAHLGNCPDCAAFLKTYRKTIEATRGFLKLQPLQTHPPKLTLRRTNTSPAAR